MGEQGRAARDVWLQYLARGVIWAGIGLLLSGVVFYDYNAPPIWQALALGLVALGIGVSLSLRLARRKVGEQVSRPAPAGPVTGCVVVAVGLFLAISVIGLRLLPSPPRERARKAVCLSNAKNIALAFQMYLEDSDGVFPPADNWCDLLRDYVKNDQVFECREAEDLRSAYAFNSALSGVRVSDIANPDAVVAVFESPRGWNATGGPEALPAEPRHFEGDNYGLASGGATWVKRGDLAMGAAGIGWSVEPAK